MSLEFVIGEDMKKHIILIVVTTFILLILVLGVVYGMHIAAVTLLTFAGQVLWVFMVISILKAPVKVEKTFDEYFYLDKEFKRNTPDK